MEKSIYLCGHTGSINRGSEAIVRSTIKILRTTTPIESYYLCTFNRNDDIRLGIDNLCKIVEYNSINKHSFFHYVGAIQYRLTGLDLFRQTIVQKSLFERAKKDDLLLQIGGDIYCYGKPFIQYSANILARKKSIKNILWGCSIEHIDAEMINDLLRYHLIFPRESLTYGLLKKNGIPEDKLVMMADPAFILDEKESITSSKLDLKNCIGINLSPIGIDLESKLGIALNNVRRLIRHILSTTDMTILLIPHVYDLELEDYKPLMLLFSEFSDSVRVQIINDFLNCEELKYIIGRCRFFVGARTHSTIAAYSSCVPTIVLGYSIKSKGIAKDLFGSFDKYVIETQNLKSEFDLTNSFIWVAKNELMIKKILSLQIPIMKKRALDAGYVLNSLL